MCLQLTLLQTQTIPLPFSRDLQTEEEEVKTQNRILKTSHLPSPPLPLLLVSLRVELPYLVVKSDNLLVGGAWLP